MKAFWDRVLATRAKGICDVEIDEVPVETADQCEVELI
jgi:hypothetical protein